MERKERMTGWALAYDWEHPGDEVRDSDLLSLRLAGALRERRASTGRVAPDPDKERFGRYVEGLRRARGWTRIELARRAAIDPLAVPLLENAMLTVDEVTPLVPRVARAFGLSIQELAVSPFPRRPEQAPERTAPAPRAGASQTIREKIRVVATLIAPPHARLAGEGMALRDADAAGTTRTYAVEGYPYQVSVSIEREDPQHWALVGRVDVEATEAGERAIAVTVRHGPTGRPITPEVVERDFICSGLKVGLYEVVISIEHAALELLVDVHVPPEEH